MVGNLRIPTDKLKALRREIKRWPSRATLVLPLKDPTLAFSREVIEQWDASYNSEPPAVDILICRMTSSQSSFFIHAAGELTICIVDSTVDPGRAAHFGVGQVDVLDIQFMHTRKNGTCQIGA